jgi:alkaline phosphatase
MKRRSPLSIFVFAAVLFIQIACAQKENTPTPESKGAVKNIILLIGDGMGNATISAARIRKGGVAGSLHMDRMPVAGFVRTSAANALIPDSAAAATALATGFKTNNGMVGMTPDGKNVQSITEAVMSKGLAAGLVATSSLTHATPASFGSHVASRRGEFAIAEGFLANKIDILLGGGRGYFLPKSQEGGRRTDERDLLREAQTAGYSLCRTKEELAAAPRGKILGLFADVHMTTKAPEPTLAEMTSAAIERLTDRPAGFFLMVEGSQIDWGAHDNDLEITLKQTLDFDEAVAAALAFAEKDGKTLVVVTADHETGGLVINNGTMDGSMIAVAWGSKGHNAATVPLLAFGPGAERLTGFRENTDIPKTFARLLGITDFPRIFD